MMTEVIKKRRKEMGLTQQELADLLNISNKTVSRWESGIQLPDVALIPEIAQVLGISISDLYEINETFVSKDDKSNELIVEQKKDRNKIVYSANQKTVRIYRLISIVEVMFALLGGIWLCIYDVLRMSLSDESGNVRSFGYIMFYGGLILALINQIWFILYRCKNDKDNYIYLSSAFKTGGAVFILIFAMAGVMIPFWMGSPFSEVYAAVCFSGVIILQGRMLVYYRKFIKKGFILKRWIPVITSAVTLMALSGYVSWMLHGMVIALWAKGDGTLAYYSADRLQIAATITDMTHRFNYFGMLCISGVLLITLIITYAYLVKKINDKENK